MGKKTESIFRGLKQAGVIGLVASTPVTASAAETVHLYLKANGSDIRGESTQTSLGRENSIECVAFYTSSHRTADHGRAGGRVTCRKRIDKSSPLILKALAEDQVIDAQFKFFRPSPSGDGTTQQFYTVGIKLGRVVSVEQVVPDTFDPASSSAPPLESVTFQATGVSYVITDGGVSHEDTWTQQQ